MPAPLTLFKYLDSAGALAVLKTGKLRWSCPLRFNDRGELKRMPRFEPTIEESYGHVLEVLRKAAVGERELQEERLLPAMQLVLQYVRQELSDGGDARMDLSSVPEAIRGADKKVQERLQSLFSAQLLTTVRILCLTSNQNSARMWSEYGDAGLGCVLGLRSEDPDSPWLEAQPVRYMDEAPIVGSGLDFLLYGTSSDLESRTRQAICYTKPLVWAHEDEWRMMTFRTEGKAEYGEYSFLPEELESVIIGKNSTAEFRAMITALTKARYPGTQLLDQGH